MDLRSKMLQAHLSQSANNNGGSDSSMLIAVDKLGPRSTEWHYSIDELDMSTRDISDTNKQTLLKPPNQASKHLLELQKEIKEEEDEIFADINSLINSRSNLYSTLEEDNENDHHHHHNHHHHHHHQHRNHDGDENIVQLETSKHQRHSSIPNGPATTFDHSNHHQIHRHHNHNQHPTNNNLNLNDYNNKHQTSDELLFAPDGVNINDYHSRSAEETGASTTTTNQDYSSESSQSSGSVAAVVGNGNGGGVGGRKSISRACGSCSDDYFHSANETTATITTSTDTTDQSALELMQQDESQYLGELLEEDVLEPMANLENDPHYGHTFNEQSCDDPSQSYQDLQAVIQQVTSNLPKPCVFFLEGNCRRSDCKYSHDLSNITCKYWIEGFCFKGEMCPFLHSYTPLNDSHDSFLLDEDGLEALTKRQLNPTFVIESEADFPSLPLDAPTTALNDSTRSSNNAEALATNIKNQILSSNPAVVFKTVKKKRKRG